MYSGLVSIISEKNMQTISWVKQKYVKFKNDHRFLTTT